MFGSLLSAATDLFNGKKNRDSQEDANNNNLAAQREFAQNGIQWKVADAKAAGLHPLAAIGGTGAAFSPSFQAGPQSTMDLSAVGNALDEYLGHGQNTERAQRAAQTDEQREIHALAVRRGQLENSLLEGQIAAQWSNVMGQPTTPPAPGPSIAVLPSSGARRPAAGKTITEPSRGVSPAPNDPGLEASSTPGFKRYEISPQFSMALPGQQLAESLEGLGAMGHVMGPVLMAKRDFDLWNKGTKPPSTPLPAGYEWQWSRRSQSFHAVKKSGQSRLRSGATGSW